MNTSDHRGPETLRRFDFTNFYLGIKSYFVLIWYIFQYWPKIVYLPVNQVTIGYLRDSIHILIAKFFGRKVVTHLRGGNFRNWFNGASAATRIYVRLVHSLVDAQIVLGECLRPLFNGLLPPDRIFVVPNGKDIAFPIRSKQSERTIVLYLGNIKRTKGVLDVLYAAREVAPQCPGVEFVISGEWHEVDLRREIEEFLSSHPDLPIRWTGPLIGQEKLRVLANADIFVFPTYYEREGHPWVVVEAMAAGLPIVSTDQGSIRESVIDGANGFLIQKQKPRDIAEKLCVLLQDPGLRERMGRRSRELYEEKFTEDIMVAQMMRVFDVVLAR